MYDLPVPDLRVLEQQYVLVHMPQLGKRVEQPLDNERAGHSVAYLVVRMSVRMRVVPIEAGRLARRDADLVILRPAGRDVEEHVVRVPEWRDGQPVHVEVRGLVERVDEPHPDDVARSDT